MLNAIEVRDLTKQYRGSLTRAVDGISFEVGAGQLFCLLGPNAAGKTTTVSILTTTLLPTSGMVRIGGHDVVGDQSAVRRQLGIVFQGPSLDLNLTAEENIRLHAVIYGVYPWRPLYRMMPREYRTAVLDLASVLGVDDILGKRVRLLSGGTRRKLEIVRALMHHPRVLFLDEPTAGLAPETRRSLWSYLREARGAHETTIFLTTHYLEEAEEADNVCIMSNGVILERGRPADIKSRLTRPKLLLDARDREQLRRELSAMDVSWEGSGPLSVSLKENSAQSIIRGLSCELTTLHTLQPTLEDAYLTLIERPAA